MRSEWALTFEYLIEFIVICVKFTLFLCKLGLLQIAVINAVLLPPAEKAGGKSNLI